MTTNWQQHVVLEFRPAGFAPSGGQVERLFDFVAGNTTGDRRWSVRGRTPAYQVPPGYRVSAREAVP